MLSLTSAQVGALQNITGETFILENSPRTPASILVTTWYKGSLYQQFEITEHGKRKNV